jgi:hypothetical protein
MLVRRARSTGLPVSVGTADEFGLDADGGATKWYTVCDTHGSCVGHSSRRLAVSWASAPADWCEFCAGVAADPCETGRCGHSPYDDGCADPDYGRQLCCGLRVHLDDVGSADPCQHGEECEMRKD